MNKIVVSLSIHRSLSFRFLNLFLLFNCLCSFVSSFVNLVTFRISCFCTFICNWLHTSSFIALHNRQLLVKLNISLFQFSALFSVSAITISIFLVVPMTVLYSCYYIKSCVLSIFFYRSACGVDDFKCDNGYCIPASKHCDRTHDCQDRSDERGCIYGLIYLIPSKFLSNSIYLNRKSKFLFGCKL